MFLQNMNMIVKVYICFLCKFGSAGYEQQYTRTEQEGSQGGGSPH